MVVVICGSGQNPQPPALPLTAALDGDGALDDAALARSGAGASENPQAQSQETQKEYR